MALAGLSDEQARRWLEQAAECSLDFRFSIKGLKRRDFLDPAFINDSGDEQPFDFLA